MKMGRYCHSIFDLNILYSFGTSFYFKSELYGQWYNGEAITLHAKNGEFHNSQDPRPFGVPWVNFNGVSSEQVQYDLEIGLTAYICENFDVPSCL